MRTLLPLLALCAACAPVDAPDGGGGGDNGGDSRLHAAPAFRTQLRAPSPDYRALIDQPVLAPAEGRVRAATAPPPADAGAIGAAWLTRLRARGALLGFGLAGTGADAPVALIDTGLTEAEFRAWAQAKGWPVPGHIRWSFVSPMRLPPVSAAAAGAIRMWPAARPRTGIQPQALFAGRVMVRDGCFRVAMDGQPADALAWFHAEVGLDIDPAGYLILRDRVSGQTLARLGEAMNWAGPASAQVDADQRQALHAACGPGAIRIVGTPEARERMLTRYPHLRTPAAPPPPPPAR